MDEDKTPRIVSAFGFSSMAHVVVLVAAAFLTWGDAFPKADPYSITTLSPELPCPEPLKPAIQPDPTVIPPPPPDPLQEGEASLTGQDGRREAPEALTRMPDVVPEGALDQSGGGETPGATGGNPDSTSLADALMRVDLAVLGRMKVPQGSRDDGTGRGAGDPYGFRPGPKGPSWTRIVGPVKADAIARGLDWLVRHQDGTGAWSSGFDARCRKGHCTGVARDEYDPGVTALAVLAFLTHGDTPERGKHAEAVRRALLWLKGQQAADGSIGMHGEKGMYNHALATLALAEACGMGSEPFRPAAEQAVRFLVGARNPGAGWRYRNFAATGLAGEDASDTSVTGWAVMALKAARTAGIEVPDAAFQDASAFLDTVMSVDPATYRATYGYTRAKTRVNRSFSTTTSVGLLCRLLMGQQKAVGEATEEVLSDLPAPGRMNLYGWYYGTMAMFQVGGMAWTDWNRALGSVLVQTQTGSGCDKGSWDPSLDAWGAEGGRVYTTATALLCLEAQVRYLRVSAQATTLGPPAGK